MRHNSNSIFDFFGLPRELRDIIYDELPTTTKRLHLKEFQQTNLWVIGHELPKTNLLLVSQQFNHEYRQRNKRIQRLAVEDHLVDSEQTPIDLTQRITSFPAIDFSLFAGCACVDGQHALDEPCTVATDLQFHRARIEAWVAQMPALRSLTVALHLDPRKEARECDRSFVRYQSCLTGLRGLERLDVLRIDFDGADGGTEFWDYSRVIGAGPVASWMPGMDAIEVLGDEVEENEMR